MDAIAGFLGYTIMAFAAIFALFIPIYFITKIIEKHDLKRLLKK